MDEEERKKRVRERRKSLREKEIELDLHRDLKESEFRGKQQDIRNSHTGKYGDTAILFFGTLLILYGVYFISRFLFQIFYGAALGIMGFNLSWLNPLIHGVIWTAAVVSAIRKRSVLDDLVNQFL